MGDIDERMMGRAASQSRFLPNDQQVIRLVFIRFSLKIR